MGLLAVDLHVISDDLMNCVYRINLVRENQGLAVTCFELCEMMFSHVSHLLFLIRPSRLDIFAVFDELLLNIGVALGGILIRKIEVDVVIVPSFATHESFTSLTLFGGILGGTEPMVNVVLRGEQFFDLMHLLLEGFLV